MSAPLQVGSVLKKNGALKLLLSEAIRITCLGRTLSGKLPKEFVPHTKLASLRDGCLVLLADTPAWATRLRYATPQILQQLSLCQEFASVRSIRVRVVRPDIPGGQTGRRNGMTDRAAAALRRQAGVTKDCRLRTALERLAKNKDSDTP